MQHELYYFRSNYKASVKSTSQLLVSLYQLALYNHNLSDTQTAVCVHLFLELLWLVLETG